MVQTLSQLVSDMQSLRARLADGTARNADGEPARGDVDAAIDALDQSISALTGASKTDDARPEEPVSPPYAIIQQAPGEPDDLRDIRGISSATANALTDIGITRFAHIAGLTARDVAQLRTDLGYRCTLHRDNWIEQAAILAKGQSTSFSRRGGPIGSPVVVPVSPPESEAESGDAVIGAEKEMLEDNPAILATDSVTETPSENDVSANAESIDEIEPAEDTEPSSDDEIAANAILGVGPVAAIAAVLAEEASSAKETDAEADDAYADDADVTEATLAETNLSEDESADEEPAEEAKAEEQPAEEYLVREDLAAQEDTEASESTLNDPDSATQDEIGHAPDIVEVRADDGSEATSAALCEDDLSSATLASASVAVAPDPYAAGPFEELIPAPEPTDDEMAAAELIMTADDDAESDQPADVRAALLDEQETDASDSGMADEANDIHESIEPDTDADEDHDDLAATSIINFDDETTPDAPDDDAQDLETNGVTMNGGFTAGLGALLAGSTVAATANENDNDEANDDIFEDDRDGIESAAGNEDAVADEALQVSMTDQDSGDVELEDDVDDVFATLPEPVAVLPDLTPVASELDPEPPTIPITARSEPAPHRADQIEQGGARSPEAQAPDQAPAMSGLGAMLAAEHKPLLSDPEEEEIPSHQAFDLEPDAPPFAPIIQSREPVLAPSTPEASAISIQISEQDDAATAADDAPSVREASDAPVAEAPPPPPPPVADRLSPRSATIDPLPEPFSPHKSAVDEAEIVIVRDGEVEAPPVNIPKLDERDAGSGLVGRISRMFNRKS